MEINVFPVDGQDSTKMNHTESGSRADNLFYQLRRDGEDKWLFLCHVNKASNEYIAFTEQWEIAVCGIYRPVCYDTLFGEIYPLAASYKNGKTYIEYKSSTHGSLLLRLEPQKAEAGEGRRIQVELPENVQILPEPATYELQEENCMLLDQAEYAFDGGEWQEREELLRIDNLFREKTGYPLRMEAMAQPWTQKEEGEPEHMLKLRFAVKSEIALEELSLGRVGQRYYYRLPL